MKAMSLWGMMFLLLSFGLVGCSTLTDALNERAAGGATTPEDAALRSDILTRLSEDPVTAQHAFAVSVDHGMVVLRGWVPDDTTRLRARSVVASTPGVIRLEDRITR